MSIFTSTSSIERVKKRGGEVERTSSMFEKTLMEINKTCKTF
jgi:hypothetical protein